VIGMDSLKDSDGQWRVRQYTGDPSTTRTLARLTMDWLQETQQRGAGEIVLNCMGSDGTRDGFDIEQLKAARAICHVPLVASGGAGTREHFASVFAEADVDAALASSIFHSAELSIPALKAYLHGQHFEIRRS
jgi:cyclase